MNAQKTVLLVKPDLQDFTTTIFAGTSICIFMDGAQYLGSAIRSSTFISNFVSMKVYAWEQELQAMMRVASTEPHAAYAALSHGLHGRWTFLLRTLEFSDEQRTTLDSVITE